MYNKPKFIVYSSNDEVIVCLPNDEDATIKLYFTDGGRDIEEYDRNETYDLSVQIESRGFHIR